MSKDKDASPPVRWLAKLELEGSFDAALDETDVHQYIMSGIRKAMAGDLDLEFNRSGVSRVDESKYEPPAPLPAVLGELGGMQYLRFGRTSLARLTGLVRVERRYVTTRDVELAETEDEREEIRSRKRWPLRLVYENGRHNVNVTEAYGQAILDAILPLPEVPEVGEDGGGE